MGERKYWNEKAETMSKNEVRRVQWEKLERMIEYCYNSSIYYRRCMDIEGIKPGDIKNIDDFRMKMPLFDKEKHRECIEESLREHGHPFGTTLCSPLDKIRRCNATSGTTGIPTFYGMTQHDIDITNEVVARAFWRAGIRPGDRVITAMALSMFLGGEPLIGGIRYLGGCPIPVGAEAGTERLLRFAQLTKPSAMLSTPSYALYLIERAPQIIGGEVMSLGLKRIICAGEPGAGLPAIRSKLEQAYGAKIYDFMGTGYGMASISCDALEYQGMHFITEDNCFFEILDPETKEPLEMKEGAEGEMCLTSLEDEGCGVLRYAYGDIVKVFAEPCRCGMSSLTFRYIVKGRSDDMLIVKGVNVYPAAIKEVVASFAPQTTGEIRVVLDEPGPAVKPPLKIRVEYGYGIKKDQLEDLSNTIKKKMREVLRFTPQIEFLPPDTLERTTHKTKLIEKRYEKK